MEGALTVELPGQKVTWRHMETLTSRNPGSTLHSNSNLQGGP